jgi:hypothetical protein
MVGMAEFGGLLTLVIGKGKESRDHAMNFFSM